MEDLLFQINDRVDKEHKDRNAHVEKLTSISEKLTKTQASVDDLRGAVDGHGVSLEKNQKAIGDYDSKLSEYVFCAAYIVKFSDSILLCSCVVIKLLVRLSLYLYEVELGDGDSRRATRRRRRPRGAARREPNTEWRV